MHPIGRSHPDVVAPLQQEVDRACREVGRDPATLERSVAVAVSLAGHDPGLVSRWGEVIAGPPDRVAPVLARFAAEGFSRIIVAADPMSPRGIEALAPVVHALAVAAPTPGGVA